MYDCDVLDSLLIHEAIWEKTALHYALHGSDAPCEILSCLIENGGDVNAGCRYDNQTPLMITAGKPH